MANQEQLAKDMDKRAAAEPSLARGQEIAADADRLRGYSKQRRVISLPFTRN